MQPLKQFFSRVMLATWIVIAAIAASVPAAVSGAAAPTATATPISQGFIAFVSDDTGLPQILTLEPDGGSSVSALTNGKAPSRGPNNSSPVWSPDGQLLAFINCAKDSTTECFIYVMNNDGSGVKQITTDAEEYGGMSWSPDGATIVFAARFDPGGFPNLFTVPSDGSSKPTQLGTDDLSGWWPSWSPDGSKIAFQAIGGSQTTINVINADGSNSQMLTNQAATDLDPVWSPDGKSIAFVRGIANKYAVWIMDADGKNPHQLTPLAINPDPQTDTPIRLPALTWSPDSQTIVFNTHKSKKWELDRVDVNKPTNVKRFIIASAEAFSPTWTGASQ
jgi:Tol biopolymer transport system component